MNMHANVLPPLSVLSLQVTDACNLACSYCYFRDKEPNSISADMISRALDVLEEAGGSAKAWHINLFGGEPTLFPKSLEYIIAQTNERAARSGRTASYSMTTNGTRFDDRMLSLVKAHKVTTLLSLDGNRRAHDAFRVYHNGKGSFDDVVRNLPRLKQAEKFSVRMTVSIPALPFLAESIAEMAELGIESIATSVVVEDDWTEDAYELFGQEWLKVAAFVLSWRLQGRKIRVKGLSADFGVESQCRSTSEYGCGAATSFLFVDAKGDFYPCHRYPGYFNKSPQVRLGSVFTGIDSEKRARYVAANKASAKRGCSSFIHPTRSSGACSQCGIQAACGGACMAVNENSTGDPTRPPPVIGRIKQIMLAVQEQVDGYCQVMPYEESSNGRRGSQPGTAQH